MIFQFENLVQNFELKIVGGVPKGHQFALESICYLLRQMITGGIWRSPAAITLFASVSQQYFFATINQYQPPDTTSQTKRL